MIVCQHSDHYSIIQIIFGETFQTLQVNIIACKMLDITTNSTSLIRNLITIRAVFRLYKFICSESVERIRIGMQVDFSHSPIRLNVPMVFF
jgi:hypothetical protein